MNQHSYKYAMKLNLENNFQNNWEEYNILFLKFEDKVRIEGY
jgi:hypothetical protein